MAKKDYDPPTLLPPFCEFMVMSATISRIRNLNRTLARLRRSIQYKYCGRHSEVSEPYILNGFQNGNSTTSLLPLFYPNLLLHATIPKSKPQKEVCELMKLFCDIPCEYVDEITIPSLFTWCVPTTNLWENYYGQKRSRSLDFFFHF